MKKTVVSAVIGCVALAAVAKPSERIKLDGTFEIRACTGLKDVPDWGAKVAKPWKAAFDSGIDRRMLNPKDGPAVSNVWERGTFVVPEGWSKDRLSIKFDALGSDCIVFVNGERLAHLGLHFGEVDVTDKVHDGENELLVYASRTYTDMPRTAGEDILRGDSIFEPKDFLQRRLGVERPGSYGQGGGGIWLRRSPRECGLESVKVVTSWREKKVRLEIDTVAKDERLFGLGARKFLLFFTASIPHGNTFAFSREVEVADGRGRIVVEEPWENPVLWDLYRGNVYDGSVMIVDGARLVDVKTFKFGFREVWAEGRDIRLNGHVVHFHPEMNWLKLDTETLGTWRELGLNTFYWQPHLSAWAQWGVRPIYPEDAIDLCDREGLLCFLPTYPSLHTKVWQDPRYDALYSEIAREHMSRYWNHPSVMGWTISMNCFNPKDSIHPDTLGQRSDYRIGQGRALAHVAALVRKIDPTRLAGPHADGNLGDFAGGNTYPNWTPVQEIRDYAEIWRRKGDMPYFASEYDTVYSGCFLRDIHESLYTEYGARFFGEAAYDRESEEYLRKLVWLGVNTRSVHGNVALVAPYAPLYYDIRELYVTATDKYWREAGVNFWQYFHGGKYDNERMKALHAKWRQPFIAFIGGETDAADVTHVYRSGDLVKKTIRAVWDGKGRRAFRPGWALKNAEGKNCAQGAVNLNMTCGDITNVVFSFKAPNVKERTDFTLVLGTEVDRLAKKSCHDELKITVFPALPLVKRNPKDRTAVPTLPKQKLAHRVVLFDPKGLSGWVTNLVENVVVTNTAQLAALDPAKDMLVVGREALVINQPLPWTLKQVKEGLRVLVLEQQPDVYDTFGFRTEDVFPREVYGMCSSGRVMEGLEDSDLASWRGRPTLLPEYGRARNPSYTAYPKGCNRHVVASTVIEIPEHAGFWPLLQTEFDLAYTPLLRWPHGKGGIIFSTLDLTDRVGPEPGATVLAGNILAELDTFENPEAGKVKLHFAADKDELAKAGIGSKTSQLWRVTYDGELAKILPRNLSRFRDAVTPALVTAPGAQSGGLYFRTGDDVYVQLGAKLLETRWTGEKEFRERIAMRRSVIRLRQLESRVRTAFGAQTPDAVSAKFGELKHVPGFVDLKEWYVMGPYRNKTIEDLDTVFPGEKEALAGDLNPNYMFDGRLDFRTHIEQRPDGFVDIGAVWTDCDEHCLGYAIREVESDTERDALLRLGFDWWVKLFVNGEYVPHCGEWLEKNGDANGKYRFGCPAYPNGRKVKIHLKKGRNVICIKIRSGHSSCGFWANLSEPGADISGGKDEAAKTVSVYETEIPVATPFSYSYW